MQRLTRGAAIRAKCIDCCGGYRSEVRQCPVEDCPLWRYRMGFEDRTADYEETEAET